LKAHLVVCLQVAFGASTAPPAGSASALARADAGLMPRGRWALPNSQGRKRAAVKSGRVGFCKGELPAYAQAELWLLLVS
jgi:hypothetical protein